MSISIGKHICSKLSGSNELKAIVADRIFPISTKNETVFPFILYKRSSLIPNYTKDRYGTGDNVTADIIIADDSYFNCIMIAQLVRLALENKTGEYGVFNVIEAKVVSADEDFIEDTFIQRITFSFETE